MRSHFYGLWIQMNLNICETVQRVGRVCHSRYLTLGGWFLDLFASEANGELTLTGDAP